MKNNIIAKSSYVFILEITWAKLKQSLSELQCNQKIFEVFSNLLKTRFFHSILEKDIFSISKLCKKTTYLPGTIIIPINEKNHDFFFLISGRVKLKDPHNKTIRIYDEGNCFGEWSILHELPNRFNFIAKSSVQCLKLAENFFLEILQNNNLNDFIRKKTLLELNEITLNDLYYISYLGRGRFGNVILVHNKIFFYAVKAISIKAAEKEKNGIKYLINEKKTMKKIDHPFITKLVKTLRNENWCFLLQELISGKNFHDYLNERKNKENLNETKFFAANLFEIVFYLNKIKIIHRDFKPTNLMIDFNGYLKLIDFGTAKKLKKNFTSTIIGTPNFIAPEILLKNNYSFSCDFWSIGVIIFYIFYGFLPFGNKAVEIMEIYKEIIDKKIVFKKETPFEILNLLNGLLQKNPNERMCNKEKIKNLNVFANFDWELLKLGKIKPFCLIEKDKRINEENLNILNSPFNAFMENESFETGQMQSLKIYNKKKESFSNISKWFENF